MLWMLLLLQIPVFEVTVQPPAVSSPEFYVVVFSAPYCVPCRVFAASQDMTAIKQRYTVREIDITRDNRWGIDRVPEVWLCRVSTTRKEPGHRVHRFVGRCTVQELKSRE